MGEGRHADTVSGHCKRGGGHSAAQGPAVLCLAAIHQTFWFKAWSDTAKCSSTLQARCAHAYSCPALAPSQAILYGIFVAVLLGMVASVTRLWWLRRPLDVLCSAKDDPEALRDLRKVYRFRNTAQVGGFCWCVSVGLGATDCCDAKFTTWWPASGVGERTWKLWWYRRLCASKTAARAS
jgi:hypothetical protein